MHLKEHLTILAALGELGHAAQLEFVLGRFPRKSRLHGIASEV